MKKITIIFAALALSISARAFTPFPINNETLLTLLGTRRSAGLSIETSNKEVSAAFKTKFRDAVKVEWKKVENFYFAYFELNKRQYSVAYSADAEMIAISRELPVEQLPLAVTTRLQERFEGYKVSPTVTEIVIDSLTNYYLTLENDTRILKIKCSAEGYVSIEKKTKKKILVGGVS